MMWSEVSIHQGDKTDNSKRTSLMTNQWEECQFTINHTTNCVLSCLRSQTFILLSSTDTLCWEDTGWSEMFYLLLFFWVRYPSCADYDPTLYQAPRWAEMVFCVPGCFFFSHCCWPTNTARSSSASVLYSEIQRLIENHSDTELVLTAAWSHFWQQHLHKGKLKKTTI